MEPDVKDGASARGIIFWLTGLSGAGKSENASRLASYLRKRGRSCVLLDGDDLRSVINAQQCFSRGDRVDLGIQYGKLCNLIARQGVDVVIATIALYSEIHEWKKRNFENCCTIYLDVPVEELRRRDPKKIYERYFARQLTNVAGLDLRVDIPENPSIHVPWQDGLDREKVWEILRPQIDAYIKNSIAQVWE